MYTIAARSDTPTIDHGWRFVNDIGALLAETLTSVEGVERRGSALSIPPDLVVRKKEVIKSFGGGRGGILDYSLYVGIVEDNIKFISYESTHAQSNTPQLMQEIREHIKGLAAQLVVEGEITLDLERSFLACLGYISQDSADN